MPYNNPPTISQHAAMQPFPPTQYNYLQPAGLGHTSGGSLSSLGSPWPNTGAGINGPMPLEYNTGLGQTLSTGPSFQAPNTTFQSFLSPAPTSQQLLGFNPNSSTYPHNPGNPFGSPVLLWSPSPLSYENSQPHPAPTGIPFPYGGFSNTMPETPQEQFIPQLPSQNSPQEHVQGSVQDLSEGFFEGLDQQPFETLFNPDENKEGNGNPNPNPNSRGSQ
ncbi:uncharacterized protein F4822DRAFT_441381 [Hypoxylon trugodes]|uniref:uncharacterized protein n=1 Tax=Hypoxylon trugodes TaxID=326681 RepID=UPI002190351F|nr:uncharacterized protein F4822DRAFT_441381 [Hypoxylon trugodes]KAI1392397.1 hypothetical protein F4822DRAFT_441381 [Hypoxylon trugodes]